MDVIREGRRLLANSYQVHECRTSNVESYIYYLNLTQIYYVTATSMLPSRLYVCYMSLRRFISYSWGPSQLPWSY